MAPHPERLVAWAFLAALALSLLFGVVLRDQVACSLVEASNLTMIGPKVFADAPKDAGESALLLDLARQGRERAAGADAIVIFADSSFWRGEAESRTIAAPLRACVVIGPQARSLDKVSRELARAGSRHGDAPPPPPIATGVGARKLAPPQEAKPTANAVEAPVTAKPEETPAAAGPAQAAPAAGEAPPPTPQAGAPTPIGQDAAAAGKADLAPAPAPSATTGQAEPPPASGAAMTTAKPIETRAPAAPNGVEAAASRPAARTGQESAAARKPASAPPPAPTPSYAAPRARSPASAASAQKIAPRGQAPPIASIAPKRIRPGQHFAAPQRAYRPPVVIRHIRPASARLTKSARSPQEAAIAAHIRIAAPRAAQQIAPAPRRFAEPSLWDRWERDDANAMARRWRRIDTPHGLLYQARHRGNENLCSTDSTNGYYRCRKANMRHGR